MTYFFSGVIAPRADEACAVDLAGRFGGVWRPLPSPHDGFALAFAADHESPPVSDRLDAALVAWSAGWPGFRFLRMNVECFGGVCEQSGFAFADGAAGERHDWEGAGAAESVLERLAPAAGLVQSGEAFDPFTRNWFPPRSLPDRDRTMMRIALEAAREGQGRTGDNPSVGCVIWRDDGPRGGAILAEARTADGGRPHAEETALAEVGEAAAGATAYVTLEPCAQRSSGAPGCAHRLLSAGITRVVVAASDPHPFADGQGYALLETAGVRVERGLFEREAAALNAAFFAAVAALRRG